jgi:hypothetical protein
MPKAFLDIDSKLLACGAAVLLLLGGAFYYLREPAPREITQEEAKRAQEARERFFAENPEARKAFEKMRTPRRP